MNNEFNRWYLNHRMQSRELGEKLAINYDSVAKIQMVAVVFRIWRH